MPQQPNVSKPSGAQPSGAQPSRAQPSATHRSGPLIITALVVILLILHQDNWFWNDGTLVFGFLPIALFWHACISIGATVTWILATRIAWPITDDAPPQKTQPQKTQAPNTQPQKEGGE